MHSRLVSWSRNAYLAGIVLALVLVIPTAWFPFQLGKLSLFGLCALVAVLLLFFGGGVREFVRSRGFRAALLVALLPLAYALSAWFSTDASVSYIGYGAEADTVLFTTLAFVAFLLSFAFFRTLRTVRLLLTVLSGALALAALFQLVIIVFGTSIIPFQTFADRSVNLVGKWNDFGLLVGLLAVLLLVRLELMPASKMFRYGAVVAGLVLAALLGLVNFPLIGGLLLVFSLTLAVIKFVTERSQGSENSGKAWFWRVPWAPVAVSAVSLVFLFFGSTFNLGITSVFPVSSLEVRPSYESTMEIGAAARESSPARFLVGSGPNTFGEQWLLNKPQEVNESLFWNVDFNVGFSTLATALTTAGLLGLLAWLVPILLVFAGVVRALRLSVLGREDRGVAVGLIFGSTFLFLALALYVPSQSLTLLAFALMGAAFGFLWRQGQESVSTEAPPTRLAKIGLTLASLCLIILVAVPSVAVARRFMSEVFVNRGLVKLQAQNAEGAFADAGSASRFETTGSVLRLALNAGALKLGQIISDTSLPQAQARTDFEQALQKTLTAGGQAAALNPGDYRPHLLLAAVYDFLARPALNVDGAYDSALVTYTEAKKRNPKNPGIPFVEAQLEAARGSMQAARTKVGEALTLKPNYTDAILFVVQLDVLQNDIPSAIQAATAAAQTAPGVAPIWFQLGLLYYAAGNAQNAAAALERAVAIVPDYANAKYFLGLSYAIVGRSADATAQFEDLERSNPDNAEIKAVLENLRAGRQPFEGQTPAVTPKSKAQPPAPIEE